MWLLRRIDGTYRGSRRTIARDYSRIAALAVYRHRGRQYCDDGPCLGYYSSRPDTITAPS
jgi:hypothetical protein